MEKIELNSKFMLRAVELAKLGRGRTNPNPMVGAVIVKDGVIIGEGFHKQYGSLHAEREAILDCRQKGNSTEGAAIYVTLEPCQMCSGAIVQSRIKRVVIGAMNPKAGCGGSIYNMLEEPRFNHVCEVKRGCLEEECSALLKEFFKSLREAKKKTEK